MEQLAFKTLNAALLLAVLSIMVADDTYNHPLMAPYNHPLMTPYNHSLAF
jgi:hypothetical protein